MLNRLPIIPPDPIFGLCAEFANDPRKDKVNLIVGVYRDETGQTPRLKVVEQAEKYLAEADISKAYRPLIGNVEFNANISDLLLGEESTELDRAVAVQTVGASGALRQLGDFIKLANQDATIWTTNPGYINHRPIFETAGLTVKEYPWQQGLEDVDIDEILDALKKAKSGDILLLHGCCHNPSGIELSAEGWQTISLFCQQKNIVPFVDIAYQGFGEGLEQDANGLRHLVKNLPIVLCAASCSKNMGLYCDRVGAALVISPSPKECLNTTRNLENLARTNYSMPPEHGAAVANFVFNSRHDWESELDEIRLRIKSIRQSFCDSLQQNGAPDFFEKLRHHTGMFSILPLNVAQMQKLRSQHGIYGGDSGRVNIAGLTHNDIPTVTQAIMNVIEV